MKSFRFLLIAICVLGAALRLHGIHNPILDHPNWRQGDTANIARNFYRLNGNILYPQTNYDGPPPHYVELELQIIPYLAAALYHVFGIHPIFGRLLTLGFSVATIFVLGLFGRWLFDDALGGLVAALAFAIFPGSIYYGRTFTPDAAMVFFLTAALYATARLLLEDLAVEPRRLARAAGLCTMALLAKPVALAGLVGAVGPLVERLRAKHPIRPTALIVLGFVPLVILEMYDHAVRAHAQWRWASGILDKHVLPHLLGSFTSIHAFARQIELALYGLNLFRITMLGSIGTIVVLLSLVVLPRVRMRSPLLLPLWFLGAACYTYAVIAVERVDYYLFLLLPPCALAIGGAATWARDRFGKSRPASIALAAGGAILGTAVLLGGLTAIAPYYHYSKSAYRNAVALDRALPRNALPVIAHYGPDIFYYMDRFGWEEDPYIWTPFDEESAIAKGSRYFISIEDARFRKNLELCAWMSRFPLVRFPGVSWPVYHTSLRAMLPGARRRWRAFRRAEHAGQGRAFLTAHGLCLLHSGQG